MNDLDQEPNTTIPAGMLFILTSGEYDDYRAHAICRATADLKPYLVRKQWFELHPEQLKSYGFKAKEFAAWLVDQGLIEVLQGGEWNIECSYYTSPMEVTLDASRLPG